MHDIAMIRQEPEAFDAGLARRGAEPVSAKLLDLDSRRRGVLTELQEAQNRRNAASKAIGQAMGKGDIRSTGSGNIGATNAVRAAGKGIGAVVLLLDALKSQSQTTFFKLVFESLSIRLLIQ